MDPVAVVQDLGPLVVHAAAKDVRINPAAAVNGVLDNGFRKLSPEEPRTNLGGDEWANAWPKPSAWDFVALGQGHDAVYWTEFLRALYEVDADMWVNIEHEDTELGRDEGVAVAAARAAGRGRGPGTARRARLKRGPDTRHARRPGAGEPICAPAPGLPSTAVVPRHIGDTPPGAVTGPM